MLGVNQSDFMSYMSALKSNYRKGVHRMEAILSNPTHAKEFAANLGGVSVVLGVPVNLPDRNSDKLLELLLGSAVADNAVETWLHQFYEFTDWDDLLSDSARCQEMANNPLIWRAAGGSKLAVGKSIATLAGLSCSAYKDIDAVVASSTAMAAIIANSTALNAVVTSSTAMAAIVAAPVAMAALWRSDTAIKALQANATAWKTFTGATSAVMGKTVAILANLDPSGYADMTAIAASSTAMTAIQKSPTALNAIAASSMATAKYAAGAAGLNPADYADMKAVAASSTAMAAVAASSTAMAAVGNSITAMSAISASSTALTALCNSPLAVTTNASTWGSSSTLLTGKRILVGFSQKQYSDDRNYSSTLGAKTAGSGSGDFTITLNAANYNKYQPMAVVVNPLVWRSNDWGGDFSSSYINGVKTIPIF